MCGWALPCEWMLKKYWGMTGNTGDRLARLHSCEHYLFGVLSWDWKSFSVLRGTCLSLNWFSIHCICEFKSSSWVFHQGFRGLFIFRTQSKLVIIPPLSLSLFLLLHSQGRSGSGRGGRDKQSAPLKTRQRSLVDKSNNWNAGEHFENTGANI